MTVQIVSPSPRKETVCRECKAGLSYTYGDITSEYQSDYGADGDTVHKIECPQCKNINFVGKF